MSRGLLVVALLGCVLVAFAEQPWLGKWEATDRSENWDAFVTALGKPLEQYGGNHKVYHKLWKEGDKYHHGISVPDKNFKRVLDFKLGEEGTSSYNNTEFKYTYKEQGNDLVAEYTAPSKGKSITDTYHVEGDELVKTYKTGDVTAKRWYKKFTGELAGHAA